jgi:nitrogen-specific signal transduction histidine kinase
LTPAGNGGCGVKSCRVTIEDNGPGIPPGARRVLLEPACSYRNRAGGSGLGLYLVRVLVDSFKGAIDVDDRNPGEARPGVRITITLPAADSTSGSRPAGNAADPGL